MTSVQGVHTDLIDCLVPRDTDSESYLRGDTTAAATSVGRRPQRLNNAALLVTDDDDACYRSLADSMTAGAYQIKLTDRMTVLSR